VRGESIKHRADVTDAIKDKTLQLVKEQKDFTSPKKHSAAWYRNQVGLDLNLVEDVNPSIRSYEDLLRLIRHNLRRTDPLGEPWTIGSCEKNGIPDSAIPMLIEFQKYCNDRNKELKFLEMVKWELSVRDAKWMARLFPSVDAVAKKYCAKYAIDRIVVLSWIAKIYSKKEFYAGITDKSGNSNSTFNTYKIDKSVFYEPHTTVEQWFKNIGRADIDLENKIKMINDMSRIKPGIFDEEIKL